MRIRVGSPLCAVAKLKIGWARRSFLQTKALQFAIDGIDDLLVYGLIHCRIACGIPRITFECAEVGLAIGGHCDAVLLFLRLDRGNREHHAKTHD